VLFLESLFKGFHPVRVFGAQGGHSAFLLGHALFYGAHHLGITCFHVLFKRTHGIVHHYLVLDHASWELPSGLRRRGVVLWNRLGYLHYTLWSLLLSDVWKCYFLTLQLHLDKLEGHTTESTNIIISQLHESQLTL